MKLIYTILSLVLVAVFAFMFVFCVFLPRTTVSDYSILKEWPQFTAESFFSGKYFSDVMYCFTDTIYGRDRFIDYEAKISDLYGLKDEEQIIVINPDADEESEVESKEESSQASSENPPESTFIPDESLSSEVTEESSQMPPENDKKEDIELSDRVYIVGTRGLELYSSNEKQAVRYAEIISEFAESLDPSVNVYSMVIPKSSAYYLSQVSNEKIVERYAMCNKNDIDKISETLSDRVIDVNIYNTLGLHANEEIYARTDHHWTALGAYYASEVFARLAGVGMDDISEFEAVRREGYLGTYFTWSGHNTALMNNPEDFLAFYPDADYTATYYSPADLKSNERKHEGGFFWEISDSQRSSWYSTFIRGDSYSVKAYSNDCKNGRKLLIVKDSYGNALAPFMLEGFEEIYIVDGREFQLSLKETINEYGITDVLFAQCTFSTTSSDTKEGKYLYKLKEICK